MGCWISKISCAEDELEETKKDKKTHTKDELILKQPPIEDSEETKKDKKTHTKDELILKQPPIKFTKKSTIKYNIDNYKGSLYKHYKYCGDDLHMIDFNEKTIFFYNDNIYRFPIRGWFQKCFVCGSPTGQIQSLGNDVYLRVCPRCNDCEWSESCMDQLETLFKENLI